MQFGFLTRGVSCDLGLGFAGDLGGAEGGGAAWQVTCSRHPLTSPPGLSHSSSLLTAAPPPPAPCHHVLPPGNPSSFRQGNHGALTVVIAPQSLSQLPGNYSRMPNTPWLLKAVTHSRSETSLLGPSIANFPGMSWQCRSWCNRLPEPM